MRIQGPAVIGLGLLLIVVGILGAWLFAMPYAGALVFLGVVLVLVGVVLGIPWRSFSRPR